MVGGVHAAAADGGNSAARRSCGAQGVHGLNCGVFYISLCLPPSPYFVLIWSSYSIWSLQAALQGTLHLISKHSHPAPSAPNLPSPPPPIPIRTSLLQDERLLQYHCMPSLHATSTTTHLPAPRLSLLISLCPLLLSNSETKPSFSASAAL